MKQQTKTNKNATAARRTRGNTAGTTVKEKQQPQGEHGSLLEKFFLDQLKDIYYAEHQIIRSLPKLQEAATSDELKEALDDHLHETNKQVKRLEKVFDLIGEKPEAERCEAIEGIAREADDIINETRKGTMTRDAALIMAAQKVEHYEIATYGGLIQLAITLGLYEAAELLEKTIEEEEDADLRLTNIAETCINIEAEEEKKYTYRKKAAQEEKVTA